MTLSISIESSMSPDGRALVEASQLALLDVYTPDAIFSLSAETLDQPGIAFFVARDDGRAVGCVALVDCGAYGEVKRLYVVPEGRGRGIAVALMARLEAEAAALGLPLVRLETGPELTTATAIYAARGYRERGPFGQYSDHPASLFMEKAV